MSNELIADAWASFLKLVIPNAGPVQVREMRKAFYAGASILFRIMTTMPDSEDDAMKTMTAISDEVDRFGAQLDAEVFASLGTGTKQ